MCIISTEEDFVFVERGERDNKSVKDWCIMYGVMACENVR